MEAAALTLRTVHIAAGTVALVVFGIPLVVRKGSTVHRRAGWVYVGAMFIAACCAVLLAPIRLMQRPSSAWGTPIFLAYVALLSFTSCFYGVRVLQQKKRTGPHTGRVELIPPLILLGATVLLLVYGLTSGMTLAVAFAPVGVLVGLPQWLRLRRAPVGKTWWLMEHLSAMLAAVIGTLTAVLVVNAGRWVESGNMVLVWLAPTFVLTPFIVYWRRSYSRG